MKKRTLVLRILLIALLCFIWGHSMIPRDLSQEESLSILRFLKPVLEIFVGRGNATDHMVRKLAHFCEFAALGAVMELLEWTKHRRMISLSLLTSAVSIAAVDESIQLFSDGRGALVSDILLDSAGTFFGMLIMGLILQLGIRLKRK